MHLSLAACASGLVSFDRETVSLDTIDTLRNLPPLLVAIFDVLGCRAAVPFANVGVSRAHGLVPGSSLWCTGPSPCTTEDHPWLLTPPSLLLTFRLDCCHHQSRLRLIAFRARRRGATFVWPVLLHLSGQPILGVLHFRLLAMPFRLLAIWPLLPPPPALVIKF